MRSRSTTLLLLLASLSGVALIGCGDDGGADDASPTTVAESEDAGDDTSGDDTSGDDTSGDGDDGTGVDACSLVTTEEDADVLQEANPDDANFGATAESQDVGEASVCAYSWESDSAVGSFEISVFPASNYFPFGEPEPIDGIAADEAFEDNDNFYARRGDRMVHVVNVQQGMEADVALLRIAAERLPG
jgi:hypothetical protein